ncbi:MAG: nitroreductase family deazaflavin-dependent oxidoreductase [Nocardiopsis sp. BM-2018]|uniref:Deazaflavin-dependent oxidoreductase (Nitroreductase family) n=1 Tax=Nocardiopsis metallicus TaxID=179819 RepID=A0A840WEZ6_9ACTN|nr:nitroreductase family deazaflavin-dependent oxidoreductase [Nocardiopsis metallicus]MBB5490535.1 deazaflavin-dependent oxidoreductase (nitroreductase family) [Nocardiopsis metallicus]QRN79810.1 MAG: nitroreductase family deazaflavin-dependent oxidoreductase [Nocardiopsis sp. BM-2018]
MTTSEILPGEYVPSPSKFVRDQVEQYERSGGREANTLMDTGMPVVILTTRGRSSGKVRKSALMRVEHDGEYAVIGSQGGAPSDPAWVGNLRAAPDEVALQDGPEPFAARAREVEGEERRLWWERAVAAYPPYADYQEKTDRLIPVFVISRAS